MNNFTKLIQFIVFLLILNLPLVTRADFSGPYAPASWTLVFVGGGNGSVNTSGAPANIILTGNDGVPAFTAYTYYQATVTTTGFIVFDWNLVHSDPGFDEFGYSVNGVNTLITDVSGTGTTVVPVNSGDLFAFYAFGSDGCCGTFNVTISNFSNPTTPPPPPPPAACQNFTMFPGSCVNAGTGSVVTISTCSFAGEYSCITGVGSGGTYVFTSSAPANYITIREGSFNGPVLGFGTSPLTVTTTSSSNLYAHWNLSGCGTDFSCHTTTVQCLSNCPIPVNPCDPPNITNITACAINQLVTLSGTGVWNTTFCGFSVPGQEKIYSFTPTQSGMHNLIVTGGNGWIDYAWRSAATGCGPTGWTCIDDIFSSGTVAFGPLTAGQTYYILADAEGTGTVTHTMSLGCPPPPCPMTFTAPYLENFETFTVTNNGTGLMNGWTNVPSGPTTLFRWTPDEGTTPSSGSGTGPAVDHTLGSSTGNYVFTESSSGGTGAVAEIISPCINLGTLTNPALKFWYHMYGASTGQLRVDISTNQGNTWILDITTALIGQQQPTQASPWLERTVSLAPWAGQQVKLRFRGIRGTSFTGDMAIDDFEIFNQSAIDLGVTNVINPVSSGTCGAFGPSVPVEITLFNNGAIVHDFTTVPATITANITGPVPSNIVYVHNTGTLAPGASMNVIIGNGNFSLGGVYNIAVNVVATGDGNTANDNYNENVTNQTINTFPFLETFESVTAGQFGALSNGWTGNPASGFRWESEASGVQNSFATGPLADHTTGNGIYMYTEASSGLNGSIASLISPCIDFTGNTAPAMSFWYHMFGVNMGELHLDVSTNNGSTWITDVMPPIVGQQQTSETAPYLQETVYLDAFAGQQVLIRFRGIRANGFEGDMAIDDINIYQQPPCDPFTLTAGTASSDLLQGCPGDDAELTLSGNSTGLGLTVQWEHSTDNVIFTPIPGANTNIYSTGALPGGTHYYRAVVTCAPNSTTSNVVTINISDPQVVTSNGAVRCGQGNVTVSATTQPGNSINWYLNPTGGTPVATSNSYTTFVLGDTTFYAAASDGGPPIIFSENFESNGNLLPAGWSATGLWHVTSSCTQASPPNPSYWAYYGIDAACNFNSGGTNSGNLTSPVIAVPGGQGAQLSFSFIYNGEGGAPPSGFDNASLRISQNGGPFIQVLDLSGAAFANNIWLNAAVDLTPYVGSNIQLQWNFNTVDGIGNTGLGLQVDQIEISVESCESLRVPVAVTVTPAPQVDAGLDRFICNGQSTVLSATGGTYNSFLWLPDSLAGQSVTVSPTENTTYILIADDGICGDVDTVQVDVVTIVLNVTSDKSTVCGNDSAQFDAVIPTNEGYSYSAIPFNSIAGSGTPVSLTDDAVSAALPIGFTFDFFGTNYTQFFISSNGFITFSTGQPNGCCTGQTLPNTATPNNLVAFAWEDLNPGAGGTIEYFTTGVAPNRKLVMNFNNVPHFGSSTTNITSQVVLYEGSNYIEIHTTTMPSDGGNHTMGIENSTGTEAVVVSGRNSQNWSTSNEGIRFMPPSTATYSFSWSPATGVSDPNIADPMVLPPLGTSTVYTVTTTHVASGCTTTGSLTLNRFDPQITSTQGATRCGLGNVTLNATGDGPVDWYDQAVGGTKLHTGNSFTTFVTGNTDFYVETTQGGVTEYVGAYDNTIGAGGNYTFYSDGLVFNVLQGVTINTVYVYPNAAGNVVVNVETSSGSLIQSVTVPVTTPGVKTAIPLGISLSPGTGYRMHANGTTTGGLFRNSAGAVYPYTSSAVHITNAINNLAGFYYFFYDWQITTGCVSPRVPVSVIVTPAPPVEISGNQFICGNESTTLNITTGISDYTNFDWSPSTYLNTTSGSSVIAFPTADISYIVLASGNVNNCQNADTIEIDVVNPPPLNLTSTGSFFCDVASTVLSTGGGGNPSFQIGFGTSNSATTSGPVYISAATSTFKYSKHIAIYSAAELIAAGGTSGLINQLSWFKTNSFGYTGGNATFNIYVKQVPFTQHASTSINWTSEVSGATLVYSSTTQNLNTSTGWQDFVLTTPFNWDGTSNLEIFVDFFRPGNATGAVNWQYTTTTNASAITGGSSPVSTVSRNSNRPNIKFGFAQNLTYLWSPATGLSGTTTPVVTATPSTTTTYTVAVTDQLTGCVTVDSIEIIVEATPTPVITSTIPNPVCQGQSAILSTQYSSVNGYQFSWNSGLVTGETINASIPGVYDLIVASPNGCYSSMVTYTVEISSIFADLAGTTDVLCNGGSDGTATINVLGSIIDPSGIIYFGPFNFSADGGPQQSSPTLTGLAAGPHTLQVHDPSTGCVLNIVGIINEPPPLVASATVLNNVSCFGGSNGNALASASGGVGPYTYIWMTPVPKATDSLDNVGIGTYTVIVTDANGCVDSTTVTITEPPLLTVDLGADDVVLWGSLGYNGCDTIYPITNGGTAPYTWAWSSPDDPNLSGGAAGPYYVACNLLDTIFSYIVVVTDANGCTATDTLELLFSNVNCSNNNNSTKIKICHVPPGNPQNCVTICVQVAAVPAMLAQGSYLGQCLKKCAIPASAKISNPIPESSLEISPNPTSGRVNMLFMSDYDSPTDIIITDVQGRELMRIKNDMGNNFFREIDLGGLSDGIYIINVMVDDLMIKNSKVSVTH